MAGECTVFLNDDYIIDFKVVSGAMPLRQLLELMQVFMTPPFLEMMSESLAHSPPLQQGRRSVNDSLWIGSKRSANQEVCWGQALDAIRCMAVDGGQRSRIQDGLDLAHHCVQF